ncbi:hypothetical protein C1T17_03620 [Sphingobium sp. SCG-1]|uniref:response regulator n=1 Tax=Sphingobium sp. SCG-1 TaxID=2072936 RepID=UPI000CD68EB1|nr:response regulator [Sphingobium sp. SCG-1]AUW57316.1 hypothetical protein C1T17_03620 [Sphingobium sp. SCG-1]
MIRTNGKPLEGLQILVVEDEYLIAMDMDVTLTGLGAQVVGPAPSIETALIAIANDRQLDVAVMDINLGEERSYPVAEVLAERGVPVIFVTGYDDLVVPDPFASFPRLNKPFNPNALKALILESVDD